MSLLSPFNFHIIVINLKENGCNVLTIERKYIMRRRSMQKAVLIEREVC
jgi:hypothetical protein